MTAKTKKSRLNKRKIKRRKAKFTSKNEAPASFVEVVLSREQLHDLQLPIKLNNYMNRLNSQIETLVAKEKAMEKFVHFTSKECHVGRTQENRVTIKLLFESGVALFSSSRL